MNDAIIVMHEYTVSFVLYSERGRSFCLKDAFFRFFKTRKSVTDKPRIKKPNERKKR